MSIRVVCISDTHMRHDKIVVPPGDVLIHAGDFTRRGSFDEVEAFGHWLRRQEHPYKVVIAGNHDLSFESNPAQAQLTLLCGPTGTDNIYYLQDQEITLSINGQQIRIYGSPWQPEFCNWAFNLDRGEPLRQKWKLIPDRVDILVTHGPPMYVQDMVHRNEHVGCEDLTNAILQVKPKLHVCGHIHEAYGVGELGHTKIANSSICTLMMDPVNKPHIFDIDEDQATHVL